MSLSKRHTGLISARANDRSPWQRQILSEYLHWHQQTDKAYVQRSGRGSPFPLSLMVGRRSLPAPPALPIPTAFLPCASSSPRPLTPS